MSRNESRFFASFLYPECVNPRLLYALQIILVAMKSTRRLRQCTLSLLVLLAVGHANLAADLTGRAPSTSGMTRLGRDLTRKSGESCCREAALESQSDPFRQD